MKGLILAVLQGVGSKWSLKLVSHALQSLRRLSLGSLHHKWKKKKEKNFFSISVLNKEKQTGRYLNCSFYFRCLLNGLSSKFKFRDCFPTFFWLFLWSVLKLWFKRRQRGPKWNSASQRWCGRNTLAALLHKSENWKPLRKSWPSYENRDLLLL